MKNRILIIVTLLSFTTCFSQQKKADQKEGWGKKGKISFLFNQSAFSNWVAGGDNNLAGNISLNYDFNYKKNNFIWNNKVIASYGLTKSQNTDFPKKTSDGINYNSMFGIDADRNWFYSVLVNFKTQFTKGYKYTKDENGKEIRTEHTDFMSPGYLLIGPGMLWEKSKDFKFNLAPATIKFVFVDKDRTLPNSKYFGVEEGESIRFELGFSASLFYKFKLMENVTMENILAFYSNYLDNPQNIDLNYRMNIDMSINKYLSANFIFNTIYDDNAFKGFQVREVFGIGVNYKF